MTEELLVEKYRPKTWDEVVGQDTIVKHLKAKGQSMPHLLFVGPPGCGKTTLAHVISNELDIPIIEKNASDDRGIGIIRGEIKRWSSITGKRFVLLDEADKLTPDAQDALRRIIEKSKDTRFILCGNYDWKFSDAIKSRCTTYIFQPLDEEVILNQLINICQKEGVEIKAEDGNKFQSGFKALVKQSNGDLRTAINTLEKILSEKKEITEESVFTFIIPDIGKEILHTAYGGDFEKAQKLVEDLYKNSKANSETVITQLYNAISGIKEIKDRTKLYIRLAETQRSCRQGNDPIIELISFIAYTYLVPHLNNECPVLKGEY